ncbi:two-component system, chemotaxis family, protein-glutamate methylesterase/glutaminase [Nitratiruptor sp. YY08-26]|uniref:chemotaxis protein CheB n=1 Tax=unclassified Nitratiruptor TaxID=2624044 RepID=UPI001914DB03|nr:MULTISPECIES: chemotaxis protein CheB [unclassified Nitratiruptor]BCD62141.1 two-component system, chemotaxis family, protein-glutamate methylesterase/glutaminase [Nitratiruptor sp. YY08-13]BCD66077.1 two-component system, chemotaxis family, protein-glutamate methylesterase/glutaminase [Nitratiruptor sp. YY08-26]
MKLVFIGASAGSICSLDKIVKSFKNIDGAIVMAVHLQENYIDGFVEILRENSSVPIKKVDKKAILEKNQIYICDSKNVTIYDSANDKEILHDTQIESLYKPDINQLLLSVVQNKKDLSEVIAILLSGIGDDGIEGLKKLHENGAKSVVASKESVAVYGMPKRAVQQNACSEILSFEEIVTMIKQFLQDA